MRTIDELITLLLRRRGIEGGKEQAEYLSPRPQRTWDPFLLPDMKEGTELILRTIDAGGSICLYGDYDADGVTSIAVLYTVLRTMTEPERLSWYIPSRFDEGYGLHRGAIEKIHAAGTDLLVTVDCGSSARAEADYARELGMEILITDHHSVSSDTSPACLFIDPKRPDSRYPFDGLAGCGVAYKLAQALQRTRGLPHELLARILDLVAIGTIGDIVPLVDENRTIVKYGLRELNSGRRESLRRFCERISLTPGRIGSEQVAFAIVPHLNAAGRMASGENALRLLLAEDRNEIMLQTEVLRGCNQKRRELQQETFEKCLALQREQCPHSLFPVIDADDVHEGVIGIVAGGLKDRLHRPVLVLTPTGEALKGSGRSIDGLNLYQLLKPHESLFTAFGGHSGACGLTMPRENLNRLRRALDEDMQRVDPALLQHRPHAELDLAAGEASCELAEALEALAPFGKDNPQPVFRFRDMIPCDVQTMGKENNHLRFTGRGESGELQCVLFRRAAEFLGGLRQGQPLDVYGTLSVDSWNGRRRVQVIVEDLVRKRAARATEVV
ncbi:MAG: single-stranded-DNA-specific exonuclease RecJ [Anaerovoracaceae bacterium]|jgi:single-stranded-DNA-specific exonuclease